MEENKTTRVNRTVNYYSDRPDYDRHMEKHNCHCERPHYDHCPEKPEYDHYPERPHYDHYPVKPDYDHYPVRPHYDHYPVKPDYDHHSVRPNYDQYEDRPKKHDCYDKEHECNHCEEKHDDNYCPQRPGCDPRQEKTNPACSCCCPETKLRPNECGKCCEPIKLKCPDINCAVCTPILANRVFDFKCASQRIPSVSDDNIPFIVDPRPDGCPPYTNGAPVCIEKVTVVYDCLGFMNDSLEVVICNTEESLGGIAQICCPDTAAPPLFTSYEGEISSSCFCNQKASSATLAQNGLVAVLRNFQYIVEGFIGCEPFIARNPPAPADFTFPATSLFTNICLPKTDEPVTLRAQFDLNFVANAIVPSTPFNNNTFDARVFNELLINEKIYVTKSDILAVYSASDEFKHHEK